MLRWQRWTIFGAVFGSLVACGEETTLVAVVPGVKLGARSLGLGETVPGRTSRFYEPRDALFVKSGEGTVPAPVGLERTPLATESAWVTRPLAALHADAEAKDRGTRRLAFGAKLAVVRGLRGVGPDALLVVEAEKPSGFVRVADVKAAPPTADELMRLTKDAFIAGDRVQALRHADAAFQLQPSHVGAARMVGALLNNRGDARGWYLWSARKPAEPPSAHVPRGAAVERPGPAFVTAANLSRREKPDTHATRLMFLDVGRKVEITASFTD